MTNNYQNDRARTSAELRHAMPETVNVSMTELAEDMREGLLALAVGTGVQVMPTIMAEDVTVACGPKGRHDPDRAALRHGTEAGSVTLGGRRVPVTRLRCAAPTGPRSCRCPHTSCSPLPRSSGGWRWAGYCPGCRRAATATVWSRSGNASNARDVDEQVGGQPPDRRRDRDRAGRAARRPAGRAGPGRADGSTGCTSVTTCAW